jgi:hypothetical protein
LPRPVTICWRFLKHSDRCGQFNIDSATRDR